MNIIFLLLALYQCCNYANVPNLGLIKVFNSIQFYSIQFYSILFL